MVYLLPSILYRQNRRESPSHEKKLSGDPFSLGAGYAAFSGWGPSRGPVPAGGYFSERPPRALMITIPILMITITILISKGTTNLPCCLKVQPPQRVRGGVRERTETFRPKVVRM
eukprot:882349-Prorocentrum_minimum.AAC.5